jgi:hypothetical protein
MPTLDHATVARHVAGATWGDPVHSCHELIPGVFSVDTPGHGGLIAILAAADIPARAVRAARTTGRLRHLDGVGEIWVAEEDCEAYALLWSCPAVLHAHGLLDAREALAVASAHCADFVAAYRHLSA